MNNKFFSFKADFFKQQGKVKEKRTILKIKVLNFFSNFKKSKFKFLVILEIILEIIYR